MKIDSVEINGHFFTTKVAIDDSEFEQGLMFEPWPPPVMSFPFRKAGVHKFYMKNTISPLDIVFSYRGRIVHIAEGKPMSLDHLGPDSPIDLVVELPKGTVNKYGIDVGQKISLHKSLQTLARSYSNFISGKLKSVG